MRNDSATVPTAIPPTNFSGKRNHRPKMPLMAAPASGSNGTSQMYLYIKSEVRDQKSEIRNQIWEVSDRLDCSPYQESHPRSDFWLLISDVFLPTISSNQFHLSRLSRDCDKGRLRC